MVRLRYADLREWMMREPAVRQTAAAPDAGLAGTIAIGAVRAETGSLTRRLELLRSSQRQRAATGRVRGAASARRAVETAATRSA